MEKVGENLREKLLLVADRRTRPTIIANILSQAGYALTTVDDNSRAFELLGKESPDLVVIDPAHARTESLQLCFHLKTNSFTSHIPIIILGTTGAGPERVQWFNNGADVCLDTPYHPAELVARIRALLRRNMAYDTLTHFPNIAYLHRQLDAWLANNLPTALIYADVDHLQPFMSVYGQDAANRVLVRLAELIVGALPRGNVAVARFGNDEFMVVLPPTGAQTFAQTLVEQFRAVRHQFYPPPYSEPGYSELIHLLGKEFKGPLLTLSAALVSNERRVLINYVQATAHLSQLMTHIKAEGGDRWESG